MGVSPLRVLPLNHVALSDWSAKQMRERPSLVQMIPESFCDCVGVANALTRIRDARPVNSHRPRSLIHIRGGLNTSVNVSPSLGIGSFDVIRAEECMDREMID